MPTPEQQREYVRLSGLLKQMCIDYMHELPSGTTSVVLTNKDHKVRVEAFDRNGEPIGIIPNENTSTGFVADLTRVFANAICPDSDGVIAFVSS